MTLCTCIKDERRSEHTDIEKRINHCDTCDERIREWTPEELVAREDRQLRDYAASQAFPGFGLTGMTMRAYIAAQLMSTDVDSARTAANAKWAVEAADALMRELLK